jgi:hypothetical protein
MWSRRTITMNKQELLTLRFVDADNLKENALESK